MLIVCPCISRRRKSKKSDVCDGCGTLFCIGEHAKYLRKNFFGDWEQGVVLFKYTIQGNEYTFMKRSVKRSIFIQVLLFGMKVSTPYLKTGSKN